MHRWSKLFIPTLREAPADAEVASHKFLLRAGYIRQVGAGIYSYLFLGQRSINKIQAIVRQEMDRIGQEFLLPALHPRELWEESGRWTVMGPNLFKLQDRKGAWLVLGMTEEEVMTDIARKELRSYKQLPQIWYQIQTKFRDEPRPRAGLLRVRQFIMKDSYSFDLDAAGLDVSYNKHDAAYRAIFTRSGLNFVAVQADSGAMGGSQSQEFMVYAEAGEDLIASCPTCNYAANVEKATSRLPAVEDLPPTGTVRRSWCTPRAGAPSKRSARFSDLDAGAPDQDHGLYGLDPAGEGGRGGDRQPGRGPATRRSHAQPSQACRPVSRRPGTPAHERRGDPEYLSCARLVIWARSVSKSWQPASRRRPAKVTVILDLALEGPHNLVAGANREEYHLRNVTPGRDFHSDPHRRRPQRHGGGKLPPVSGLAWQPAEGGKSHRGGTHFQAWLPVLGRHGGTRIGPRMARK